MYQTKKRKRRVAQRNQSAALRQPRSRVRITARRRKAPLNGRRLVLKTRVTARSGVRFLSLPPNQMTDDRGQTTEVRWQ